MQLELKIKVRKIIGEDELVVLEIWGANGLKEINFEIQKGCNILKFYKNFKCYEQSSENSFFNYCLESSKF